MEQQVGPLGKPMSTAIKRSIQVSGSSFLQDVQSVEHAVVLSGCFLSFKGTQSPDGKGWSETRCVHGFYGFLRKMNSQAPALFPNPGKSLESGERHRNYDVSFFSRKELLQSQTLNWTARGFMPAAKSTICFMLGRYKFYRRHNYLLVCFTLVRFVAMYSLSGHRCNAHS